MSESRITNFNRLNFAAGVGNVANQNEFYANVTLPIDLEGLFPEAEAFKQKIGFACQSSGVPDMTVGEIAIPFRSQMVRLPGDRDRSGVLTMTVRTDVDYKLRDVFERWSDALGGTVNGDVINDLDLDVMKLLGQGELHQLSRNGKILKSWSFDGIWPQTVSGITFDWGSANSVVTHDVTFAFQHMESRTTRNNVISAADGLSGSIIF